MPCSPKNDWKCIEGEQRDDGDANVYCWKTSFFSAFVKKAAKKIAIFRYLRTLHPNEKKLCVEKFIFDKKGKPWKCHFANFCLSLTIHPFSLFTSKEDKNNCLRIQWRLMFGNVSHCSTLWLWVDYFIYFKFAPVLF